MNSLFRPRYLIGILLIGYSLSACKKDEGPGGTSTIKGKVIEYNFDAGFQSPSPGEIYPAIDQKVYIIYGENGTTYNDDFDTSYDGTFEFKYLQKGKYRLFTYSKDSTGASMTLPSLKDIPVFVTIEITDNGSEVIAPDLIILNNKFQ